ncbi:MAG: TM2 domain-containing protein [candidate division WOR-3 bacterium]
MGDYHIFNWAKNELQEDSIQYKRFKIIYSKKKKKKSLAVFLNSLGLFGLAGMHRIYLGDYAIGALYFFTYGIFFIGTIIDFINMNKLINKANFKIAMESLNAVEILSEIDE